MLVDLARLAEVADPLKVYKFISEALKAKVGLTTHADFWWEDGEGIRREFIHSTRVREPREDFNPLTDDWQELFTVRALMRVWNILFIFL